MENPAVWLILILIVLVWVFFIRPFLGNVEGFFDGIRKGYRAGPDKRCPMCAETVKGDALKCRYCGHIFDRTPQKEG